MQCNLKNGKEDQHVLRDAERGNDIAPLLQHKTGTFWRLMTLLNPSKNSVARQVTYSKFGDKQALAGRNELSVRSPGTDAVKHQLS